MRNTKKFYKCSRCGVRAFEYLQTYGHCVNCLDVKELAVNQSLNSEWEEDYRFQYSDQNSYQSYLRQGIEL